MAEHGEKSVICELCRGQGVICPRTKQPWNDCNCGWCERGPTTAKTCPVCKGAERQAVGVTVENSKLKNPGS